MTSVQVCSYPCKKCLFIAFSNYFLPFKLDNELSNLFADFLSPNFFIAKFFIFKYTKENL